MHGAQVGPVHQGSVPPTRPRPHNRHHPPSRPSVLPLSPRSNTLKLPNFRRTSTLREKLLYAIKSGAGFELS